MKKKGYHKRNSRVESGWLRESSVLGEDHGDLFVVDLVIRLAGTSFLGALIDVEQSNHSENKSFVRLSKGEYDSFKIRRLH
jgi:hypothetical protein